MFAMGLRASFMIAWRSLSRRKTKNLSAILAVTLGVTLLVGIQITTDTLENAFLTSLLQSEGEVDLQIMNSTTGGYLKAPDQEPISDLIPEAIGIMPELTTQIPALIGSQVDPEMSAGGIPLDYPAVFGSFYDWKTGNKIDLNNLLTNNRSILISSDQAEKLGLNQDTPLPVTLTTEFTNLTTILTPPVIPLSEWTINTNLTSGESNLNSSESSLFLELQSINFTSIATAFTVNCPPLNLSDYGYVNVTATGSNNAGVILGFLLDDNSTITVANMTIPAQLDSLEFDLAPYAGRTLRGEGFMTIFSFNGTGANVNITEIAFETLNLNGSSRLAIKEYASEISEVEIQVGVKDAYNLYFHL